MKTFTWLAVLAIVGVSVNASGQTLPASEWRRGTTLAGFAGATSESSDTSAAAGTALAWEVTPRFTLEGRGTWMSKGSGQTDFFALLSAVVPLRPAHSFVPFVSGGVGMYAATVDTASGDVPTFYLNRMTEGVPRDSFRDVMFAVGSGADLYMTPHIAIRPEVSLLVVTTSSDARPLVVYGMQLAYHFERHQMP